MTSENLIAEIREIIRQKDENKKEQDKARKRGDDIMIEYFEKRYDDFCDEIKLKLDMAALLDSKGTNQINPIQLVEMLDGGKIPIGQTANPDRPKKVFVNLKTKKK